MLDVEQGLGLPGDGDEVFLARADSASYVVAHAVEVLNDVVGLGEADCPPALVLQVQKLVVVFRPIYQLSEA